MSAWCVVHAHSHQERRAEANLLRQGFRAWLPSTMRTRRHARRVDTVSVAVFPGYLFVDLDLDHEAWGSINGTFGVKRLLASGTRPQVLPRHFVEALRESVGADGACDLSPDRLRVGERVRIATGPFTDVLATVAGLAPGDRVKLLLGVLGGEVAATMPRHAVVAAA